MKQVFRGRSVLLLALASVAAGASAQQSEEIVVEAPRVYAEMVRPRCMVVSRLRAGRIRLCCRVVSTRRALI